MHDMLHCPILRQDNRKASENMQRDDIRNIAIIAHVDHGKTTLVDRLLFASGVFRENQSVNERVLDSNDQERERGITILAKNISVRYKGVKINVIDTPGHADFGGEVERVLRMADGALLIVDAFEGPMPQTRFVLRHAIEQGLRPVVVINKIDRPGARPLEALDAVFDLMVELKASDEQLDFPVVYTSAVDGYARFEPQDGNDDMTPLLETIVQHVPAPQCDPDAPCALQICTVDHSNYVGRIGVGRLFSGTIRQGEQVLVIKNSGVRYNASIKQLFTFEALGRQECDAAAAGDIVAVVGVDDADIGDMVTSREQPVCLDPIHVEEPTMAVVFSASTSPLVGREGSIVGARQLNERLMREAESNISMRISPLDDGGVEVAGRGVLHLSVLMETMRREGFEFQVGRPRVLFKRLPDGTITEPIEEATVDVPAEYAGKVIEVFGSAGGEMADMQQRGDHTHLAFRIPTRGTMGLRTRILNSTRGEAILFHRFSEYGVSRIEPGGRARGSMIAMSTEKSVAYALDALQQRGTLFVGPGEECYEGMIVGESAKEGDMVVNVAKAKQLTNMRSSTADKGIQLTPPVTFTLEEALEYIEDDELVEITPQSIRLRKRVLSAIDRRKLANKK
jgi:GTP-binding protein